MKKLQYFFALIAMSLVSATAAAEVRIIFNSAGFGHPGYHHHRAYNGYPYRHYKQRYYHQQPRHYRNYRNRVFRNHNFRNHHLHNRYFAAPLHPNFYERPVSRYKHYYHDPAYYDFKPQRSYRNHYRNYGQQNYGNHYHRQQSKGRVTAR